MTSNLKKAGTVIRKSFRNRRYAMFDVKENNYIESPVRFRHSNRQKKYQPDDDLANNTTIQEIPIPAEKSMMKRGASVTQSMREAVGTIRQKLRMSTRRRSVLRDNQATPTKAGKRRHSFGTIGRRKTSVKMSSPFIIETPNTLQRNKVKTCLSMETPTRLRREVEDLTSNMQALSTLTPNTLHARRVTRSSPPITNGSLKMKTPRSSRKKIITDIY